MIAGASGIAVVDSDDLPEDPQIVVGSDPNRCKALVLGAKLDRISCKVQSLDRGLAFEHRHHDLSRLGELLLTHDHVVAVLDVGIDHAVALNLESEAASARGAAVDQKLADHVLSRQEGRACRNPTHDGDGNQLRGIRTRLPEDLQGSRLPR